MVRKNAEECFAAVFAPTYVHVCSRARRCISRQSMTELSARASGSSSGALLLQCCCYAVPD